MTDVILAAVQGAITTLGAILANSDPKLAHIREYAAEELAKLGTATEGTRKRLQDALDAAVPRGEAQ